jgi:DNA (cytosine-5)-methyltransferase 1
MKYLSVCSGIEAATVAWHPIGWTPFAFAEIEKFPSAVLAHHYPSIPNLGDMTKFKDWPDADIDVLVGGTPCQSFSVAGLRQGLADPRGNLCLTFLAIADRYRPEWLLWENVPGVLSSDGGRDFGAFLGGLGQLGYGWSYRVLDAQYVRVDGFGRAVPQRRRRVFVVGNLRDWRRAAAVLFERESLHGNTAPRRQAGQGASADVAPSIVSSGRGTERTGDTRGQEPVIAVPSTGDVSHCLNAGGMGRQDYETETLVAHSLRADGFDASEDGTGRGTPLVPIAFSAKDHGGDAEFNLAPTLRAGGFTTSHANAGVMPAIAYGLSTQQEPKWADDLSPTLTIPSKSGGGQPTAVAFMQNQVGDVICGDVMHSLGTNSNATGRNAANVATAWAVRRLTPTECERLQGFPDDYTNIPWRGKNGSPDGPRYKALGNSMACNAMRWIGRRIEGVSTLTPAESKSP